MQFPRRRNLRHRERIRTALRHAAYRNGRRDLTRFFEAHGDHLGAAIRKHLGVPEGQSVVIVGCPAIAPWETAR